MGLPPLLVAFGFVVAVAAAIGLIAYVSWRGSKKTSFFLDTVKTSYDLELPNGDIDAYYKLKEDLFEAHALPEDRAALTADGAAVVVPGSVPRWIERVPMEQRQVLQKALLKCVVGCINELDKVQREKPGTMKLWRCKLVSERYWGSLCDAERIIGEEIDGFSLEAEELQPGWKEHIFSHAVHCWRAQKQQERDKKDQKKAVVIEKKAVEKEFKRKEAEERQKEEEKERQERAAQKAMEKLIREEENASKSAKTSGKKEAPKSKGKKK